MKFLISVLLFVSICSAQSGWTGTWDFKSDTCGIASRGLSSCFARLIVTSPSTGILVINSEAVNVPAGVTCNNGPAVTSTVSGNTATVNGQTAASLSDSILTVFGTDSNNQPCQMIYTQSSSSKCFPADALVQLQDGTPKQMKELSIGDIILSKPHVWSEVYMFSHRTIQAKSVFISLQTNHSMISLTPDHYIYANGNLVVARKVQVGDMLVNQNNLYEQVISIKSEYKIGLFNPHTLNGDVIVNGIWTSTYTQAVEPRLAHIALAPIRLLYSNGVNIMEGKFDEGDEYISNTMPGGKELYSIFGNTIAAL